MIHAMPVDASRNELGEDSVEEDLDPEKRACVMRRRGRCGLSCMLRVVREQRDVNEIALVRARNSTVGYAACVYNRKNK